MDISKLEAIAIDNDIQARMRLKQATMSVPLFGKVVMCGTIYEGFAKMESTDLDIGVVFFSSKFPQDERADFVKRAKDLKSGRDSAYVVVMDTGNQNAAKIASSVMQGADGFLLEPFSVEQLVEITRLATRVKRERTFKREKIALSLMIREAMAQLDMVAFMRGVGVEPSTAMRKLKELTDSLPSLSPELKRVYLELLVEEFQNAPIPKKSLQKNNYSGASSRVKRRMEQKIMKEAETVVNESFATQPTSPKTE